MSNKLVRVPTALTSVTNAACCNASFGVALDPTGNVWVTNSTSGSVSEVRSNGTVVSAGYSVGSGLQPRSIAVDGSGNIWTAMYAAAGQSYTVVELAGEGGTAAPGAVLSGTGGFGSAARLSQLSGLAIDSSGNVWVGSRFNGVIMELVGAASPVKTPLLGLPMKP
jgi:streptogramin lyase